MISFVNVFFTIVRYIATENYYALSMFLEVYNWCKWLDSNVEKKPRIICFYIFFTGARLNNWIPNNIMGLKILKWKCSFVMII